MSARFLPTTSRAATKQPWASLSCVLSASAVSASSAPSSMDVMASARRSAMRSRLWFSIASNGLGTPDPWLGGGAEILRESPDGRARDVAGLRGSAEVRGVHAVGGHLLHRLHQPRRGAGLAQVLEHHGGGPEGR